MKERPILFSAPMVRAILAGRKTMTRRVIKQQRHEWALVVGTKEPILSCPHGKVGDRLWVRETWTFDNKEYLKTYKDEPWRGTPDPGTAGVYYRASERNPDSFPLWRPSIHMPRWASRILLEITEIRVERLQDISEEDAWNEGVEYDQGWEEEPGYGYRDYSADDDDNFAYSYARDSFMSLWESIYGTDSWNANPWVWVVCFRRIENQ